MSDESGHLKALIEARHQLINKRRVLAVRLLRDNQPKETAEFAEVQSAIAALDEALKQERGLAVNP
jgi:hypothetical protein